MPLSAEHGASLVTVTVMLVGVRQPASAAPIVSAPASARSHEEG
jgi:hypothetical protein